MVIKQMIRVSSVAQKRQANKIHSKRSHIRQKKRRRTKNKCFALTLSIFFAQKRARTLPNYRNLLLCSLKSNGIMNGTALVSISLTQTVNIHLRQTIQSIKRV